MNDKIHVAVAGAGIVGVSCALWLQHRGFNVSIIDENEPGSGTTSGCACTIAKYGCLPINDPEVLHKLPSLLLAMDSPLRIDPWYALCHLPWMISFLKNCKTQNVNLATRHLASLLAETNSGLDPLIDRADAHEFMSKDGCLFLYEDEDEYKRDLPKRQIREAYGTSFTELNNAQIQELEPALQQSYHKGLLIDNIQHVTNPQRLVECLYRKFLNAGGEHIREMAHGVIHTTDGMKIFMRSRRFFRANRLVICCGADSRQIEGCDVEHIPLGTERGYHIQYAGRENLIKRPISFNKHGFYAVPTELGLRLAGTVEISGLDKPKTPERVDYLKNKAQWLLGLHDQPDSDWLGFRPTLPDALPVIGPSQKAPNTYFAFGHQHLGLTLAGITGQLISELVAGEKPSIDIQPFAASRFR